jgi:DNA segregation ATPase FtsK/SpoIIIE, S-DNA-T family
VEALVLRVVSAFRPGSVLLHVWDVGQLTGPLPGLRPLAASGLLTVHDPRGLPGLLEELSDRIRRVHTRVLHGGQPALRALGSRRTEPWVVAVLAGNREALREEDHRQLQRVAAGGLACGVQLVLLDVPLTVAAAVETVTLPSGQPVRTSMTGKYVAVELDPPLPPGRVTDACHAVAAAHEEWRSRSIVFADVLPSAAGLTAQVGLADGQPAELRLDDMSPHALIGGPSGSGKTNLLLTMIGALTTRYSPDELELHLLDFKEGVSFAPFAPARRAWLPHARLVGVHINTDREFGLALLQFLAAEMRRRAEAAKAHAVTKLEDLRAVDPDGRWPRIVAVIDEFQYLFGERDAVTRAAIALLEDVARRGRSQGIHLVLASQDVSGIEAFWGRRGIFEQFVLRIALPRARQVLDDRNEAALDLPRWHAVVNHESGMRHGNEIVRLPNASARGTFDEVQWRLHRRWTGLRKDRPPPRLFDGSRAPRVADLLPHVPADGPRALVGQSIDVAGSPATVAMPDAPGRNLGVFGAGGRDAVRVLSAAAASLVDRLPTGARVVVAALSPDSRAVGERLARRCAAHDAELVGLDAVRARVEELAAEVGRRLAAGGEHPPVVVVLFAADAADTVLDRAGTEALRKVVHFGPETGVHVLGWWRSVPRLKALLVLGASVDDVGAWVALDVHGAELAALLPGALVAWSSRPGRGLFFDRAQHAEPQVVIVAEPEEGP